MAGHVTTKEVDDPIGPSPSRELKELLTVWIVSTECVMFVCQRHLSHPL